MVDAAFGEILTTCEKLRWLLANAESALAPEYRPTNLVLAHKVSKVVFEPLGVVAALVSWNYPLHNALGPIVAALAAGDAIVVKPSEQVAWSSLVFIEAVRDCLAACGEVSAAFVVSLAPSTHLSPLRAGPGARAGRRDAS